MGVRFGLTTIKRALEAFPKLERVAEPLIEDLGGTLKFRVLVRECSCWVSLSIRPETCSDASVFVDWVERAVEKHDCILRNTRSVLRRETVLTKEQMAEAYRVMASSPISYDAENWIAKNRALEVPPKKEPVNELAKRFGELDFDDKESDE